MNITPWTQRFNTEIELKRQFAEELLRTPNQPFLAASKVCGMDSSYALRIANEWVFDRDVLNFQVEFIKQNGEDHYLPSKVQVARQIYEIGTSEKATIPEKLAAFRLYSDLRGFIDKQNIGGTNIVNINQNRVMVMRDHGTDVEWEEKARIQQAKLVQEARQ